MIWLSQNLRSICEADKELDYCHDYCHTHTHTGDHVGRKTACIQMRPWQLVSQTHQWAQLLVFTACILSAPHPGPGLVYVTLGSNMPCDFKLRWSQKMLLPHLSHSLACSPHTSNPHAGGTQLAGSMEPWGEPRWWGPEAFVQKPEDIWELLPTVTWAWNLHPSPVTLSDDHSCSQQLVCVHWGEKSHNQKVENYVLFGRHPDDVSLGQLSQITLRDLFNEAREEPGYIGAFTTNTR